MKRYVLILIFSILQIDSRAQNLYFQSYSSSQGLSQNSVYSMAQTSDGFMWFGTQAGINRFDGKNFTIIAPAGANNMVEEAGFGKFSKMITALYADTDDWLWLGTTYEIALYNRYTNKFILPAGIFKGFSIPNGLWIKKITEDRNKNIWILTQNNGLFCYNKTTKAMVTLTWQDGIPGTIGTVTTDAAGNVWACSNNEIYKLQENIFTPINYKKKSFPGKTDIVDMCVTDNNQLWLIQNGAGIILLQTSAGNSYSEMDFSKEFKGKKYLSDPRVIHQSDSNTIWIGSRSEGLIKINLAAKTFENADASGAVHSLNRQFILCFFTTRQKITWIGLSGGGIAKYDLQKTQFSLWRNDPVPQQPLPDNMLLSIFSQNDEDFYMGTLYGGLLHTNTKTGDYKYYQPAPNGNDKSGSKNVYAIIGGEHNLIWMATWAGLFSFDKLTKKFSQYTDVHDDQTKELWSVLKLKDANKFLVGGNRGGLRLFDPGTKKWDQCKDVKTVLNNYKLRVRYMEETDGGNVYMSTEAQNLVRYNYHSGEFTFFPQLQKVSDISRHFCFDNSWLWVATDDGLIQVVAATMQVHKVWNTNNGLPNNYIYAVVPDNYGRIWLSSNAGLTMLDHKTGVCKKFTEDDGLQGMEFNTASSFKDKGGKIWFGGINGLNMVTPHITPGSSYSPSPLITSINVMNRPYQSDTAMPYIRTMTLPYSNNFLGFEFQTPNFFQSENTMYEYMLDGVDTSWVKNGTRNYAGYTQLKPGHYTFRVRSANSNFVLSRKAAEIDITIIPPWYMTWWFYVLSTLLVIAMLAIFFQQRVKSIRYKTEAKQRITETEIAALKAQMNPHFIFNCINSIDAFIHSNDKYNATLYLNKFAKLLRNILDSSKQNTVLLTKDIETLKLYVELEELRHENKFKPTIIIDDELLNSDYKVPPLIIQPFVENAILHGLKNADHNTGLLEIEIKKLNDMIEYSIRDNGIGRKAAALLTKNNESSYGIQMSCDRIKLFNKEKLPSVEVTDLYCKDGKAEGTLIKVQLKII